MSAKKRLDPEKPPKVKRKAKEKGVPYYCVDCGAWEFDGCLGAEAS